MVSGALSSTFVIDTLEDAYVIGAHFNSVARSRPIPNLLNLAASFFSPKEPLHKLIDSCTKAISERQRQRCGDG